MKPLFFIVCLLWALVVGPPPGVGAEDPQHEHWVADEAQVEAWTKFARLVLPAAFAHYGGQGEEEATDMYVVSFEDSPVYFVLWPTARKLIISGAVSEDFDPEHVSIVTRLVKWDLTVVPEDEFPFGSTYMWTRQGFANVAAEALLKGARFRVSATEAVAVDAD